MMVCRGDTIRVGPLRVLVANTNPDAGHAEVHVIYDSRSGGTLLGTGWHVDLAGLEELANEVATLEDT